MSYAAYITVRQGQAKPSTEPEVMFRMLFIGYLYGICSETRLAQEVNVNVAYRWFLGYKLEDKIPNASVIWQNRRRRFKETDIPRRIFDEIVFRAIEHDLVEGKALLYRQHPFKS